MISTHVLDIARGVPASEVGVQPKPRRRQVNNVSRRTLTSRGRIASFGDAPFTGDLPTDVRYGRMPRHGIWAFFPEVAVRFEAREEGRHHVPLLLSPYGYSTYRGT